MSEIGRGHPECDLLLAMVDRDLPRASREVRSHVKECWKCRAHVEEFQATINDYARYQDQVLLPSVPPEPRPWMDLRLAMRQMDESRQAQR
ncbi:MAG TPA: hypothetical protein VGZ73_28700, partial [Bryobacteraceae bacterium]|nr:hypothetical protein [Bryobacteraceae bacterium]